MCRGASGGLAPERQPLIRGGAGGGSPGRAGPGRAWFQGVDVSWAMAPWLREAHRQPAMPLDRRGRTRLRFQAWCHISRGLLPDQPRQGSSLFLSGIACSGAVSAAHAKVTAAGEERCRLIGHRTPVPQHPSGRAVAGSATAAHRPPAGMVGSVPPGLRACPWTRRCQAPTAVVLRKVCGAAGVMAAAVAARRCSRSEPEFVEQEGEHRGASGDHIGHHIHAQPQAATSLSPLQRRALG